MVCLQGSHETCSERVAISPHDERHLDHKAYPHKRRLGTHRPQTAVAERRARASARLFSGGTPVLRALGAWRTVRMAGAAVAVAGSRPDERIAIHSCAHLHSSTRRTCEHCWGGRYDLSGHLARLTHPGRGNSPLPR